MRIVVFVRTDPLDRVRVYSVIFSSHRKTRHTIRYVSTFYPYKGKLSRTRLMYVLYLVDWKKVKKDGVQLTNIDWKCYGEWLNIVDIVNFIEKDPYIKVEYYKTAVGDTRSCVDVEVSYMGKTRSIINYGSLTSSDLRLIVEVMRTICDYSFEELIEYCQGTEPIVLGKDGEYLNLVSVNKRIRNYMGDSYDIFNLTH